MQNEMTKTNKSKQKIYKKYGQPYLRRHELRRGDIKLIQKITGFAYITVQQQIDGTRAISPAVKAMADKLADNNKALVSAIEKLSINE